MSIVKSRYVLAIIFVTLAVSCHGRGSAVAHSTDFKEVVNGYFDSTLWNFYLKFTSDIDDNKNAENSNSVSAQIKRRIAEKNGITVKEVNLTAHRYIAHQWPYHGAIPASDLLILERKFPGCTRDIRDIWGRFCRENNNTVAKEFGWQQSRHLAQSYCAILYYTHLLADWLPPPVNNDFRYLMPVDKIVAELQRAVERIGSSDAHKQFCKEFRMKMSTALAMGSSPQRQAELALETLKSAKLGTKLHEYYGVRGQMDEKKHPYREEAVKPVVKKAS